MKFWKWESWAYAAILFLGISLRLLLALGRTDSIWPDEQFQTLEPAGRMIFGHGLMSWEWQSGYRSWIVPSLYAPLFYLCKLFGVTGGKGLILAARVFMALMSSWVIDRLNRLLKLAEVSALPRLIGVAAFALSPAVLLWSVATLADTWAMIAIWTVLPVICVRLLRKNDSGGFALGVLAGIPLLIKLQMAFWLIGLAATALAFRAVSAKRFFQACLGITAVLAFYGLVDAVSWGVPFKSLIEQVSKGESIARFYGVFPWWDYVPRLIGDQGHVLLGLVVAAFLALASRWFPGRGSRDLKAEAASAGSSRMPAKIAAWVLIPFVFLFFGHSLVAHKETRFLVPLIPSLFFLLGFLLSKLDWPWAFTRSLPRNARIAAALSIAVATLALSAYSANRALTTPLYLSSVNIIELESAIYEDGGLSPAGDSCLLLVGHNFSFTRGQLVMGAEVRLVDVEWKKVEPAQIRECRYAILPGRNEYEFKQLLLLQGDVSWERLPPTQNGFVLYARRR